MGCHKGCVPWNAGTSKTKVTITCESCGKQVTKYRFGRDKIRFCSNKCAHNDMPNYYTGKFGRNHPRWREIKKTSLRETIRKSYTYRNWRTMIFKRDDYTCQRCGKRGCYLEVHHKIPFAVILDENKILNVEEAFNFQPLWSLDNGTTYCLNCHGIEDKQRKMKGV
jgi:5-methylcytosine-specific restriction endonuclease McrA